MSLESLWLSELSEISTAVQIPDIILTVLYLFLHAMGRSFLLQGPDSIYAYLYVVLCSYGWATSELLREHITNIVSFFIG